MRAHMQSICKQSHGAVGETRSDLDYHHRRGDEYYPQGAVLTRSDLILTEDMIVLRLVRVISVHFNSYFAGNSISQINNQRNSNPFKVFLCNTTEWLVVAVLGST